MFSEDTFDRVFGFRGIDGYTVHVAKAECDGYPGLWIRVILDDEAMREEFITRHLLCTADGPTEIGELDGEA